MTAPALPRLLLVDDEPNVLHALRRTLRGQAEATLCTDPLEALAQLERDVAEDLAPAAVVCDMRMPGLDGAATLARVRELSPDSTRLLLTGQTDLAAAVRAVNDGGVFRFLTKPCPPEELLAAVADAVAQHRLVTAEKELLEQTLKGLVTALLETLGLADPQVFTRALRVKRLATSLARTAGVPLTLGPRGRRHARARRAGGRPADGPGQARPRGRPHRRRVTGARSVPPGSPRGSWPGSPAWSPSRRPWPAAGCATTAPGPRPAHPPGRACRSGPGCSAWRPTWTGRPRAG